MEHLKGLLLEECDFKPSMETLGRFLALSSPVSLKSGGILTDAGKIDPDVYIVKDGIVRFVDMNGEKERTFAFAFPGTVFMNKHSFVRHLPSYYQVEACCRTTVLRVPQDSFRQLVKSDHEFAYWMLQIAYTELFFQEYKNSTVNNGDAKERFDALVKCRHEMMRLVPQKVIASYLGISPEYMSRLRGKR